MTCPAILRAAPGMSVTGCWLSPIDQEKYRRLKLTKTHTKTPGASVETARLPTSFRSWDRTGEFGERPAEFREEFEIKFGGFHLAAFQVFDHTPEARGETRRTAPPPVTHPGRLVLISSHLCHTPC
ncbi:hypothetical protein GCM10010468_35590 [Actinocorallia longicatena]|uniref:Uncharacterized protein n=1 Tax=Actinocorallia longicatena TaxID=111803 RepID=A0ABP6QAF3_9ACTN